jgi:hypothetical protein
VLKNGDVSGFLELRPAILTLLIIKKVGSFPRQLKSTGSQLREC